MKLLISYIAKVITDIHNESTDFRQCSQMYFLVM